MARLNEEPSAAVKALIDLKLEELKTRLPPGYGCRQDYDSKSDPTIVIQRYHKPGVREAPYKDERDWVPFGRISLDRLILHMLLTAWTDYVNRGVL